MQKPNEKIVPFVRRPEEVTPGNPLHFATAYALDGYGSGLLVESHEGRPTKIEGNPAHPQTIGATTAIEQALILGLYDDDRAQAAAAWGRTDHLAHAARPDQRYRHDAGARTAAPACAS